MRKIASMAEIKKNSLASSEETAAQVAEDEAKQKKSQLRTVRRAEKLDEQNDDITRRINQGEDITKAVSESMAKYGHESHDEQVLIRVAKRAAMMKSGMDPFPIHLDVTTTIQAIRAKYADKLKTGEETTDEVGVAGRVMFVRNTGGLCFAQMQAGDGTKLQAMVSKREVGKESLDRFKQYVDTGDILFVRGNVISSRTGELSVFASDWAIATKSLHPLPALHDQLSDEIRTREPYLSLIVSQKSRDMLHERAGVVSSLRANFARREFLEAETPMLQTIRGGANARPFITHMNAFNIDLFLRIAPELFLKRLVVGGVDKVFEINRNFRNEGADATHAPEFTMLEAYQAFGTYDSMASLTKDLICTAAKDVFGSTKVTLEDGTEYDIGEGWKSLNMFTSLSEKLGEEITEKTSVDHLRDIYHKLGLEEEPAMNRGKYVEKLWEHFYADPKTLWQPTFVRDFPVETTPLTKKSRTTPGAVEKWDLYVRGFELATADTELNDPVVERKRFVEQAKEALQGDVEAMAIDEDFLNALAIGMPPTGGMGMGIDRLLIALTGATVRDTITFPLVKPMVD
jgi:lysyl-tRNA synthetase class 2